MGQRERYLRWLDKPGNREKVALRARERYQRDPQKQNVKQRAYRQRNRDKFNSWQRTYRAKRRAVGLTFLSDAKKRRKEVRVRFSRCLLCQCSFVPSNKKKYYCSKEHSLEGSALNRKRGQKRRVLTDAAKAARDRRSKKWAANNREKHLESGRRSMKKIREKLRKLGIPLPRRSPEKEREYIKQWRRLNKPRYRSTTAKWMSKNRTRLLIKRRERRTFEYQIQSFLRQAAQTDAELNGLNKMGD